MAGLVLFPRGFHPRILRAIYMFSAVLAALTTLWIVSTRLTLTGYPQMIDHDMQNSHTATSANHGDASSAHGLASFALQKVLTDASPIFGYQEASSTQVTTSTWMEQFADDTPVVRMNIPGTHDAATWNYSLATQQSLNHITDFAGLSTSEEPPDFYRCQDRSLIDMLNAGIRAFDLRYAYDVTNSTLVFWHGPGLQSQTATVSDVLFGFFAWLDDHLSEALFLSFQREHKDDSAQQQLLLYHALTSPAAKMYINQARNTLGSLGEARGKITLLRRFDLDLLPQSYEASLPGLHFPPSKWTVNGDNIELVFNESTGATAYIEDYYAPRTGHGSTAEVNIMSKYNATVSALDRAASDKHADSLYWSFASSTNIGDPSMPKTPRMQALGNGTDTPNGGVNDRLEKWLTTRHKGERIGLVMFDFFEQPSDLLSLFLGLQQPGATH